MLDSVCYCFVFVVSWVLGLELLLVRIVFRWYLCMLFGVMLRMLVWISWLIFFFMVICVINVVILCLSVGLVGNG